MTTRVLIADDNAKVREAWQRLLLTIPNVEVVAVASDGEEAVSLAMQYRPSVVLMDISMPRLDGFEATRRIRLNAPEVRVIIVSADTSAGCVEKAFEVGADGYVAKAAAADQLPEALRAVVKASNSTTRWRTGTGRPCAWYRIASRALGCESRALLDGIPPPHPTFAGHDLAFGLDARCDYFNETWLAFTGRSLAQEIGDGWAEGVHGADLERCVSHYLDHFHRREAFEMEYRLRRHDFIGDPPHKDTGTTAISFDQSFKLIDDSGYCSIN